MSKWSVLLVLVALLTGSCGFIEEVDTLPRIEEKKVMITTDKSDEEPSKGGE